MSVMPHEKTDCKLKLKTGPRFEARNHVETRKLSVSRWLTKLTPIA